MSWKGCELACSSFLFSDNERYKELDYFNKYIYDGKIYMATNCLALCIVVFVVNSFVIFAGPFLAEKGSAVFLISFICSACAMVFCRSHWSNQCVDVLHNQSFFVSHVWLVYSTFLRWVWALLLSCVLIFSVAIQLKMFTKVASFLS